MMAGIDPHPAVKAISPQAPMIDVWMGDDFFHNGAFRQSYGYDYVLGMESSKEDDRGQLRQGQGRQARATASTSSSSAARFAEDVKQSGSNVLPTWKLFLDHPAYDTVWSLARRRAPSRTPSPCPRSASAATTTRKICAARRKEYAKPRAARHEPRELPRPRPLAARLLGVVVAPPRQSRLRRAHRQGVPRADRSQVLRALSQR